MISLIKMNVQRGSELFTSDLFLEWKEQNNVYANFERKKLKCWKKCNQNIKYLMITR